MCDRTWNLVPMCGTPCNLVPTCETPCNLVPMCNTPSNLVPICETPCNLVPMCGTPRSLVPICDTPCNLVPMCDTPGNLTIPFKIDVNLNCSKNIIVKGRPLPGARRFNLYFQTGKCYEPGNIAFHFDARFNYCDKNTIIMNYRNNGCWGPENRICNFPFCENQEFTIQILVLSCSYQVNVNYMNIAQFQHQIPIQVVDTFSIEGDVCLSSVQVQ